MHLGGPRARADPPAFPLGPDGPRSPSFHGEESEVQLCCHAPRWFVASQPGRSCPHLCCTSAALSHVRPDARPPNPSATGTAADSPTLGTPGLDPGCEPFPAPLRRAAPSRHAVPPSARSAGLAGPPPALAFTLSCRAQWSQPGQLCPRGHPAPRRDGFGRRTGGTSASGQ